MKQRFTVLAILAVVLAFALDGAPCLAGGKDLSLVPTSGPLAHQTIYSNSYALLIGINDYQHLRSDLQLHYAVADATAMREMLIRYYGFPPDHIRMLLNGDATKQNIVNAFSDFADQQTYENDDRVLIFFSGHGQTVPNPEGGNDGYLIPADGNVQLDHIQNSMPYLKTCIRMEEIWDYLKSSPAKHVLLIADACYSGLLTEDRAIGINSAALNVLANRRALQVMTAGGQGETSSEMDEYGHGVFTYKLLEELKARAQTPGEVFTTSDLYGSVQQAVANATDGKQDPQFGNYKTEGDFLFITTKPQKVPDLKLAEVTPEPPHTDENDNDNNEDNTDHGDTTVHHAYSPPVQPNPSPSPAPVHHKYAPSKYGGAKVIAIVPFSGTFSVMAQQGATQYTALLFNEMANQIQANYDGYSVPNIQQTEQALSQLRVPYSQTGNGYLSLETAQQLAHMLNARYVIMGEFSVNPSVHAGFINKYDNEVKGSGQMLDTTTGDVVAQLEGDSKKSTSFFGQATVATQSNATKANTDAVKDAASQLISSLSDALGGSSSDKGNDSSN